MRPLFIFPLCLENFLYLLLFLYLAVIRIERFIQRGKELIKGKWVEIDQIDLSDRKGLRLRQKSTEKASCRDHMILVCFFSEVFQGVQSIGTFLYLIKDDEGFSGDDPFSFLQTI